MEDEADRMVRSAAKIIFWEIKSKNYDTDVYLSTDDIKKLERCKVSLQTSIKSDIKHQSSLALNINQV